MSITSDEVNLLVYRYLQESGFGHTAFSFFNESQLGSSPYSNHTAELRRGALVYFLQRGLQYSEVETHINDDGTTIQCQNPFSLVEPHKCSIVKDEDGEGDGMDVSENVSIPEDKVTTLTNPTGEIFICSWSPKANLLATGSSDSAVRIWQISSVPSGADLTKEVNKSPIQLVHPGGTSENRGKNITTLEWSPDGTLLATGSYFGVARIWNTQGNLLHTLTRHQDPIFSIKWNKSGTRLLSCSMDASAVVWDVKNGTAVQQFHFHKDPAMDVDWKDDTIFATCSTDRTICIGEIGNEQPLAVLTGHQDEVNAIRWDPRSNLLASCSDDGTAKIWKLEDKSGRLVHDLTGHTKDIVTISWRKDARKTPLLATASSDSTIRLWDCDNGECLQVLDRHSEAVIAISFSADGKYLASASVDKKLNIWSVNDGELVKTYKGSDAIFEVSWTAKGDRLAACYSNKLMITDMKD